jgi:hypothetical protein
MPTTIIVKAKGGKLTFQASSAFPATFGTPTVYPSPIQLSFSKRKLTGQVAGSAITPPPGRAN